MWTAPDIPLAAFGATINSIQRLSVPSDLDLPCVIMRTLTEALNSGQEAAAQDALEWSIELARTKPSSFRKQLAGVVLLMLQIAEAEDLQEGIRRLALEFVVTLAEAREMMRRMQQFVGWVFAVLMKMLLDIEDEPAWHAAEASDEDAGETNYCVAQEWLNRLAIAFGGSIIVPIASQLLPAYFDAPEWQKHHAALITLAQIAEGCSKVMKNNLEPIVSMILSSFQDAHPRARWAAINAIGQLSTDLGPDLQNQYHHKVLPALASAVCDFQNPRVQAHAASAVLKFTENCASKILIPHLDGLVMNLLVSLLLGKSMVQEVALTTLASVADSSQDCFQKYYDAVIPILKSILMNATNKSNRMLCAKLMERISLVGMAVGKDRFRNEAKQVMEVLMSLQGSQMDADDPACARLCKCLGKDFLPYMSFVMPPLVQSALRKLDVTIIPIDSDDDVDESDDESIETITFVDKRIRIKTSVLKEKVTACNMLCCCACELKEGFFPWIDEVAPILVRRLQFYFDKEVRRAAVSGMPELLHSAKLAIEKGIAQGHNESYVKKLLDHIIQSLVEALHKEPDLDICASMLDSLKECIQISGHLLDPNRVKLIVDEVKNVITASETRRKERAERATREDLDAEEGKLLREENKQEDEIFDQVNYCLGTLIETFKASFLPFFDELSTYIITMLEKDKSAAERRIAIRIFYVVAEQCRESAGKYYDLYLPFLLEACNDENPDVRQAAVYGIGVCAEFGGAVFTPLVKEALSKLINVVTHPHALFSKNVMAYDKAVSALGKICLHHRDSIDGTQVVPNWLIRLPIICDLVEARIVHRQLCSMVERSDEHLLGPDHRYVPMIVSIFAEVLAAGTKLADEPTLSNMVNLLRQFQQTLPPDDVASIWSSLLPRQKRTLQLFLSA